MNQKCFNEGTLQAFLDNELSDGLSQAVARHVADCDVCAIRLAEVEEETALVFAALEQEFNTLVPTQRLWTKINESIQGETRKKSVRHGFASFLSGFSLTNPSVAAFASLFFVIVTFAVLIAFRSGEQTSGSLAGTVKSPTNSAPVNRTVAPAPALTAASSQNQESEHEPEENPVPEPRQFQVYRASVSTSDSIRRPLKRQPRGSEADIRRPYEATAEYLPGEESYVSTIATLERTISGTKDEVLSPSSRFAFEKDLAVVNDAIKRLKAEVRKNPKNDGAREFLFSSYQNKIDLLNSVAERSEMMATLR